MLHNSARPCRPEGGFGLVVMMMAVKIVMMVMAMIVEIVMTVMILDGEEILGHVTIVTSFQVYDDNQRRNHRWGGS